MEPRIVTVDPPTPTSQFTIRLSSTRRGARLARQLAVQQLTEWTGLPYDSGTAQAVAVVAAALTPIPRRSGRR
ncbi:hypothetical protein ACFRCW_07745 [Streptomyces sp. NPDC056653]|uniref:hypothetical protein n=1 Tax=Streptomyces sp. NPDC056653 TaxID=3345894 RepID=UPI0036C07A4A